MAVRIQLSSNFQVVELTGESWMDIDEELIEHAIKTVNRLGKRVINDIKTAPKSTTINKNKNENGEEKATPGQIKYLEKFGIDASEMTKKEAWETLQKLTKAIED